MFLFRHPGSWDLAAAAPAAAAEPSPTELSRGGVVPTADECELRQQAKPPRVCCSRERAAIGSRHVCPRRHALGERQSSL